MKFSFVVLEDCKERVEWLKLAFPDVQIVWSTEMNGFLKGIKKEEAAGRLKAVIMDHDLGFYDHAHGKDNEGYDGRDAAQFLELRNWGMPIVIWSANMPAAHHMEAILRQKGFGNVRRCAFMFKNNLCAVLEKALTSD